jgi:hypothetical protein
VPAVDDNENQDESENANRSDTVSKSLFMLQIYLKRMRKGWEMTKKMTIGGKISYIIYEKRFTLITNRLTL